MSGLRSNIGRRRKSIGLRNRNGSRRLRAKTATLCHNAARPRFIGRRRLNGSRLLSNTVRLHSFPRRDSTAALERAAAAASVKEGAAASAAAMEAVETDVDKIKGGILPERQSELFNESAGPEFFERQPQLILGVHDNGTIPGNRFTQRTP